MPLLVIAIAVFIFFWWLCLNSKTTQANTENLELLAKKLLFQALAFALGVFVFGVLSRIMLPEGFYRKNTFLSTFTFGCIASFWSMFIFQKKDARPLYRRVLEFLVSYALILVFAAVVFSFLP